VAHDEVPRGRLPTLFAQLFAAQVELTEVAAPWLASELPAPMAQLQYMTYKLGTVVRLSEEIRAEAVAVALEIEAMHRRRDTAREGARDGLSPSAA
jgi:hypothetical protein